MSEEQVVDIVETANTVVEPVNEVVVTDSEVPKSVEEVGPTKTSYILHITSSDSLGLNLIENIIEMANLGATLKPQTLPSMRFPHSCSMVLSAETPPTPSAVIRVFEADTNKEVFKAFAQEKESAIFSLDTQTVDKSTNDGTPWTKEQLDSMDWATEFKAVCSACGITGRNRDKMTKEYIAKFV